MSNLFDKRLIFVTGKGGVGKSTIATALGMVAARRGKRTILAEIAQSERVPQAFDQQGRGFQEAQLADNLFTISIDPHHAMEEYLHIQLKIGALADLLYSSRMFSYLSAATPGMRELLTIGKVWELTQTKRKAKGSAYDLVIVDGPASGHSVGMLKTPKTFADLARVGPIHSQAKEVYGLVTDKKQTAVVIVTLPAEMPVNETISLYHQLKNELHISVDKVIVNAQYENRFSKVEIAEINKLLSSDHLNVAQRDALQAALSAQRRFTLAKQQVDRLRRALHCRLTCLPVSFKPEFDLDELILFAEKLEATI